MSNLLLEAWARTLRDGAEQPAVLSATGAVLRRFAEIDAEADSCLATLPDLRGRAVLLGAGNSPGFVAGFLALLRAGAIPLPVEADLDPANRRRAVECSAAAGRLASAAEGLRFTPCASPPASVPAEFLKLTSGTTSAPRLVRFRIEQLMADGQAICRTMGIRRGDRNLAAISLAHSYGFSNLVLPLLMQGTPMVLAPDLFPAALAGAMSAAGVTVFPGVPALYDLLSRTPGELGPLRLCISAGAPLPDRTAERFRRVHHLAIHSFYGASECGGICFQRDPEAEIGSVGSPLEGVVLEGVAGEASRYRVRSAAVGEGCWPEPDPALPGDGSFLPADLLEPVGTSYRIIGRAADFLNVAGRKLNPLEVEKTLSTHAAVREAVVFGVQRGQRGDDAIALIVGEPGARLDALALRRHCSASLPAWKVPREFRFAARIPQTGRGKISRKALADQFLAGGFGD